MCLIKGIKEFEFVHGRQFFVGKRGKVIPDVSSLGVCREGTRGIGLDLRQWVSLFV